MLPRHTKETVIISVNIVKYFATIVNKRNETRYLKHILGCMKILNYDREAAVAYAKRWAFSRNPAFYDFSRIGGDCTNFASQCIYAGAKVMNFTPTFG